MKLNNYKVKIKHLNFEPVSKKAEYSYNDIMYLYYSIQFKSKDYKFIISSGDVGIKLLEFMQELKLLIQDKYPYAQFDGCRVSILDNSSVIDEATGDSSFKAIKKIYDDLVHGAYHAQKSISDCQRLLAIVKLGRWPKRVRQIGDEGGKFYEFELFHLAKDIRRELEKNS